MTRIRSISIADARALATQWNAQLEEHLRSSAVADRFKSATPSEVIDMWE
jgi:hypothetical protein